MEYDIAAIGRRLTEERKKHHLTKLKLAEAIGYSDERRISSMENGKSILPLEAMFELCKIFDCELAYLLCEQNCKTRTATDICKETGLSEDAIEMLRKDKCRTCKIIKESLDSLHKEEPPTEEAKKEARKRLKNLLPLSSEVKHKLESLKASYSYMPFLNFLITNKNGQELFELITEYCSGASYFSFLKREISPKIANDLYELANQAKKNIAPSDSLLGRYLYYLRKFVYEKKETDKEYYEQLLHISQENIKLSEHLLEIAERQKNFFAFVDEEAFSLSLYLTEKTFRYFFVFGNQLNKEVFLFNAQRLFTNIVEEYSKYINTNEV